jgi:adenine-specific DNA-methyltransferase
MRFIGSKRNLLEDIELVINDNIESAETFFDIFSGTGIVAEYFKKDYKIYSNDILYFSYVIQKAKIENNTMPSFEKLYEKGIDNPFDYLETFEVNDSKYKESSFFLYNNYTPAGEKDRMYLTPENAKRIDFIRLKIEEWKNKDLINEGEYYYLIACLIEGIPYVSNIAGVYGAYLKKWIDRAKKNFEMEKIDVFNNNKTNKCYNKDGNELIKNLNGDIIYIDPPYNGRQYVPNYHILETVAEYDYPDIYGVTGLRPYDDKKSKFCYKSKAASTLDKLIKNNTFNHIIMSYSNHGILDIKDIENILKKYGKRETYKLYKIPYRKYKSKKVKKQKDLYELIFYIENK